MFLQTSQTNHFNLAFRRLTIIRLLVWFGHIIQRGLFLLGDVLFKIIRFFGLLILEIGYGYKSKTIDWKYNEKKNRFRLRAAIYFFFSSLWLLPKALFHFIYRLSKLGEETVTRSQVGVREETKYVFQKERNNSFRPSPTWTIINFVITLLVIISPIVIYSQWRTIEGVKNKVLASGATAFTNLFSAKSFLEEQNVPEAKNAFSEASQNFIVAQQELSAVNSFLLQVAAALPNKSARLATSGKHLINAGQLSAELGHNLSSALAVPVGQEANVSNFIKNFLIQADASLPIAKKLEKEMKQVDSKVLPEEYQSQFNDFSKKTTFLVTSLSEAIRLANEASIFLGEKIDKRYMLVFQNNGEKRGPGGFIGSFALVDLRRGQITKLTVPKGGTYDTEAGLTRLVAAPEPLRLLNPRWHFWDANWWPDWPTSAKKLMWFYENSNGPSVDGVISLTPTVLERALEIIGPIDMTAEYGVVIDAHNFWTTTQTFSEQKPVVTKEPKKIIGDLINKIIEELPKRLTPEKTIQLIALLEKNLNEKQILAYFNDQELEKSVEQFGWGGKMSATKNDYLMVVDSNIGGQKTDRVIKETVNHKAKILPDGSIIDTLTVQREHQGIKGETFVGAQNVDWLRIYVPEGSTLISSTGFSSPAANLFEKADPSWEEDSDLKGESEAVVDPLSQTRIYQENHKTVFANWSMLAPGETATLTFEYQLPFKIAKPRQPQTIVTILKSLFENESQLEYSLLVQKQPGALGITLESELVIEKPTTIHWYYPQDLKITNGWLTTRPFDSDFFSVILFK